VRFEAADGVTFPATREDGYTYHLDHLMELKQGITLFDVYALDKPE